MATGAKKINPFYIAQQDDGWDDWSDDENEEEGAALVDQEYGLPPPKFATSAPAANGHRASPFATTTKGSGDPSEPSFSPMRYVVVVVTALVLLVLLSGSNSGNDNDSSNEKPSSHSSSFGNESTEKHEKPHLAIIGERHSGLPWMQSKLEECFPETSVSTSLQRIGYFFQDEEISHHPLIVVHMALNVYDWIQQMRTNPEYMPRHLQTRDLDTGRVTPLAWKDFVSTPWTLAERPARDLPFQDRTDHVCQMEFEYHRVMSCIEQDSSIDNPIYELQPDGQPYTSILNLRAAKLKNHQAVKEWASVQRLITVRYENMAEEFETHVLQVIEQATGWQRACSGVVLPPLLTNIRDDMTLEYVDYMADHVDWNAESLVGYAPWGDAEVIKYGIPSEAAGGETGAHNSLDDEKHTATLVPTDADTWEAADDDTWSMSHSDDQKGGSTSESFSNSNDDDDLQSPDESNEESESLEESASDEHGSEASEEDSVDESQDDSESGAEASNSVASSDQEGESTSTEEGDDDNDDTTTASSPDEGDDDDVVEEPENSISSGAKGAEGDNDLVPSNDGDDDDDDGTASSDQEGDVDDDGNKEPSKDSPTASEEGEVDGDDDDDEGTASLDKSNTAENSTSADEGDVNAATPPDERDDNESTKGSPTGANDGDDDDDNTASVEDMDEPSSTEGDHENGAKQDDGEDNDNASEESTVKNSDGEEGDVVDKDDMDETNVNGTVVDENAEGTEQADGDDGTNASLKDGDGDDHDESPTNTNAQDVEGDDNDAGAGSSEGDNNDDDDNDDDDDDSPRILEDKIGYDKGNESDKNEGGILSGLFSWATNVMSSGSSKRWVGLKASTR